MNSVGKKSILGRGTRLPQVTRLCWARSTDKQAGGRRKSSREAIEGVKTVPPDTELTSGPPGDMGTVNAVERDLLRGSGGNFP